MLNEIDSVWRHVVWQIMCLKEGDLMIPNCLGQFCKAGPSKTDLTDTQNSCLAGNKKPWNTNE